MSNQSVHITFKKGISKPSTSIIKRHDDTKVFISYRPNMVFHDLAHYAIESTLMRKSGFYWLINTGLKPEDFEQSKNLRPPQLAKALAQSDNIAIEYLANQLMVEALNSGPIENFMTVLLDGIKGNGDQTFSFPLSASIVDDIRQLYQLIVDDWNSMSEGQEKKVMVFYTDENDRVYSE